MAYADTDQMGVVYYGNYARFFEVSRTEALRSLGLRYADLEKAGVMMPVTRMNVKYIRPALYDDLLTIEVIIPTIPDRMITFEYCAVQRERREVSRGRNTTHVYGCNK